MKRETRSVKFDEYARNCQLREAVAGPTHRSAGLVETPACSRGSPNLREWFFENVQREAFLGAAQSILKVRVARERSVISAFAGKSERRILREGPHGRIFPSWPA